MTEATLRYISTRGGAPALGFEDVLLAGLAEDGGLYVPERWPAIDPADCADLPYPEVAKRVMAPFVAGAFETGAFEALVDEAYAGFDHPEIAPLVALGPSDGEGDEYLMELFHGPTLAFKDYALQLVGLLFEAVLARRRSHVTILGATSGDTGSAAIAACAGRANMDIFILHPKGRVSDVQRRQMTTVDAPNVHNLAVEGTFDDCQDLVKAAFGDAKLRKTLGLSAVNSINWARIMSQVVYYFWAVARLGLIKRGAAFAVPTGNFGNVYAGYVAKRMGLPVAQLIVGSNRNDILTRFFETGRMEMAGVEPSLSPSMDIQVSSNFERLLFDLYDRDGPALAGLMTAFRETGSLEIGEQRWRRSLDWFTGARFSDEETIAMIKSIHQATGMLLDPHTAIGVAAGRAKRRDRSIPLVALATAHPAKFPDAVEQATGIRPALPDKLADLYERPEFATDLPNDSTALREHLFAQVGATQRQDPE